MFIWLLLLLSPLVCNCSVWAHSLKQRPCCFEFSFYFSDKLVKFCHSLSVKVCILIAWDLQMVLQIRKGSQAEHRIWVIQAVFSKCHQTSGGFLGGSVGKESACDVGDPRDVALLPVLGSSPGGGHGNPLQYPCLGNPMDRGAWQAAVYGAAQSQACWRDSVHASTEYLMIILKS